MDNKLRKPNKLLKKARNDRDWSRQYVAERIGASEQTVRSWEIGTRATSRHFRNALCDLFQMSREDLGLEIIEDSAYQELFDEIEEDLEEPDLPGEDPEGIEIAEAHESTERDATDTLSFQENNSLAKSQFEELIQHINHADKDRLRFLKTTYQRWIAGVFHQLSNGPLLTLHLKEIVDAVDNPQKGLLKDSYIATQAKYSQNLPIFTIYDNANGELLLLGSPGAGKTALLLELLQELLERAASNEAHPVPVFLQLASWSQKRSPIAKWLVEELHTTYQVSRPLAEKWVQQKRVIPLLDGLDEIPTAHRAACIEAINTFRKEYDFLPTVICSRKTDYLNQPVRLILNMAIVAQPLTTRQIHAYVTRAGKDLAAMHYALQRDTRLRNMATNPFMLNMLALSYHGMSLEQVQSTASPEELHRLIFEKYRERLLHKEDLTKYHYTPEQTKHWLTWLAQQQIQHNQTEFYLERMQPEWLPEPLLQRYRQTITRCVFGIEILLNALLFSLLRGGRKGTISGVSIGLLGQLGAVDGNKILGWMAPGLGGGLEGGGSLGVLIAIVTLLATLVIDGPTPGTSWRLFWRGTIQGTRNGIAIGLFVGLFSSILFCLKHTISESIFRGSGIGLFSGLLVGLMAGLIAGLQQENKDAPPQRQSISKHIFSWKTIINTSIFTLCGGVGFGSINALLVGKVDINVIIYSTIVGLFYGIIFGVLDGTTLIRNVGLHIVPAEIVSWSWRNVSQHLLINIQKGLFIGTAVMLCVTLTIGGVSSFYYGFSYGIRYGFIYGLIIGIAGCTASILAGILHSGWSSGTIDEHQLVQPNEGIRRSARNALISALLFGVIGGFISGLACGIAFGAIGRLEGWFTLAVGFALVFGTIFALQAGIINGGIACIEHSILRFYLWQAGSIPWNYSQFLDIAARHKILWKLGGGYMFTHRLLLEHFASLNSSQLLEDDQREAETLPQPRIQNIPSD